MYISAEYIFPGFYIVNYCIKSPSRNLPFAVRAMCVCKCVLSEFLVTFKDNIYILHIGLFKQTFVILDPLHVIICEALTLYHRP